MFQISAFCTTRCIKQLCSVNVNIIGIGVIVGVRISLCNLFTFPSPICCVNKQQCVVMIPCCGCVIKIIRIRDFGKIDARRAHSVITIIPLSSYEHRNIRVGGVGVIKIHILTTRPIVPAITFTSSPRVTYSHHKDERNEK